MTVKYHQCKLGLGSDSTLGGGIPSGRWRRLRKMCQVSTHHPGAKERFHSYPAILAERARHLHEGGSYLLHPYSMCRLCWTAIMVAVNILHACISMFRLGYVVEPQADGRHNIHAIDWVMLVLNILCWFDILLNFNTGYVPGPTADIVLDRSMIARRYATRWLTVDVVSSVPAALVTLLWWARQRRALLVTLILPLLRCARFYTALVDLNLILKAVSRSHILTACARYLVIFLITCHWCSCIIYFPPIFSVYWYGYHLSQYASFLTDGKQCPEVIYHHSIADRYRKSIFVTLSTFFGTGFSQFHATKHDEILIHSLVILYSTMFMVYTFVFLLKMYLTIYSSSIRFHALINQVEEYMRHKQFPVALKKRVRAFYYYRYQERYYNEDNVLKSLSESLRNELTLHTCSRLVARVPLLREVAAPVLGATLGCLLPEVYMPNEFVFRAGERGDYMYFVASGTVAVYSLKGAEVCHLGDGAYFGEVALLMKDSKRVATVIAVEITLLYKLEFEDFKQFIRSNESVYEQVEALASRRMHETVVVDEGVHGLRPRDEPASGHRDDPASGQSINS